jgi:biotin transporter BioY
MDWLTTTLAIYASVTRRAARAAITNWPVFLSFFAYFLVMTASMPIAMLFGPLGGFLLGFVWAACLASFLYLVERLVRYGRVTFDDFPSSFTPYLSDVIGVLFVLWMLRTILSLALMANPQGPIIALVVQLFLFVFLNAVPELIYLGHHSSLDLLTESYRFISENWIEWFPPTLLAGAILLPLIALRTAGLANLGKWALIALFIYFLMVLRGFLFEELHGSTRRSRAFRYRSR